MEAVARDLQRGVDVSPLWQRHTIALLAAELPRHQESTMTRRPLERQNASRRLTLAVDREPTPAPAPGDQSLVALPIASDAAFWRHAYRDFYVVRPRLGHLGDALEG
ncbi:hypothetical protein PINS_up010147 [Pythium insidiosum]|nr:hypothetical protein PINS_up010147 [Pythium insidiosum]